MSHSGNSRGRVKRVVSCKKKTSHLTVARRRQPGTGRTCDASNKENEMKSRQDKQQGTLHVDPWELPLNVNDKHWIGETGFEKDEHCRITEVRHSADYICCILFM